MLQLHELLLLNIFIYRNVIVGNYAMQRKKLCETIGVVDILQLLPNRIRLLGYSLNWKIKFTRKSAPRAMLYVIVNDNALYKINVIKSRL